MNAGHEQKKRLLAVASGGGHWEQLLLIRDGFADFDVTYASTIPDIGKPAGIASIVLTDCNRDRPLMALKTFWDALRLIWKLRPSVVFTTGAAPGVVVLFAGKLIGVKTVWLDSVANAEKLSMSGRIAQRFVDLHCVQWQHLADTGSSRFLGRVL